VAFSTHPALGEGKVSPLPPLGTTTGEGRFGSKREKSLFPASCGRTGRGSTQKGGSASDLQEGGGKGKKGGLAPFFPVAGREKESDVEAGSHLRCRKERGGLNPGSGQMKVLLRSKGRRKEGRRILDMDTTERVGRGSLAETRGGGEARSSYRKRRRV